MRDDGCVDIFGGGAGIAAQQPAKVAAMVMIGNVFSLITMPIALWFALRL